MGSFGCKPSIDQWGCIAVDKATAEFAISELNACLARLHSLLCDVKNHMTDDEYRLLKRSIARIMNLADIEIIDVLIGQHPDIPRFYCSELRQQDDQE